ncbi:DUF983 domain-containing protein [Legionella londiniensis]|uniref:DUF983 domain-containing protein n=1 Tax=Legionella londiniensis TaxID=45068 RepID=A0A0W0VMK5_9GAMM|nr:DUF983 domain-containing protein [Legionella londiniensis]KTD21354.1 hypothetical protein Llon_1452 [Legionella londiniensis]STX93590.1 Protein of uncharacterised function (DUF983) [Legionella londiniensis]
MSKKQDSIDQNKQASVSARAVLWRGIRGRCPSCGHEKIFESYLKQGESCSNCQEDIGRFRADDGPAWLTILVIGHIVAPFITDHVNLQWTLLCSLATTGGSISWQDQDATDRAKKQKQELANKLKQTFGLSEDPVPWNEGEKAYKARFVIKAADNVLRQLTG